MVFTSPVLLAKIFRFRRRPNHLYKLAPSRPARGALAIVTNVGRDAVDAAASARRASFFVSDARSVQTNGAKAGFV